MHVAHASLRPKPQSISILIPKGNTNHYSIFFPFFHNGEDGQSSWCWNISPLAQSTLQTDHKSRVGRRKVENRGQYLSATVLVVGLWSWPRDLWHQEQTNNSASLPFHRDKNKLHESMPTKATQTASIALPPCPSISPRQKANHVAAENHSYRKPKGVVSFPVFL